MDEATLQGLRAALAVSPDNGPLLTAVLQGALAGGHEQSVADLVEDKAPGELPVEARPAAARISLAARRPEAALEFLSGLGDAHGVLRARILADLNRPRDALAAYRSGVEANPTLEDPSLAERLERAGRPGPLRLLRGGGGAEASEPAAEQLFNPPADSVSFDDVGGLDDLKKRIRRRIITPLLKPSLFQRFRKRTGGGVLLYGPPGCGKTLMARATAGEIDATFLSVQIADVVSKWQGESEQNLAAIFQKARAAAPAVLFFDEVEALGGKREHSRFASHASLVSQFLGEMDGFGKNNDGVLVLGATNVPWAIDSAFRRPGRFDRVLFVPPPDRDARAAILNIHLRDRPVAADIDVGTLAKRTAGFSGADLENLVETGVDLAIEASLQSGDEVPLRQALLLEALQEVRPTTVEWLTTARNYARYANEGGQYDEVLTFLKKHGRR